MSKKFVLIDAHSIIYRSYYAFINRPLKNSKGETTSGIFGFLNTLEKIKENIGSDFIGLAFDSPGKTFRDTLFEEYKATRPPVPEDIPFQVEKVKEICKYLGIPQYELEGYEADDILATFATKLKKQGEVYIVTSDKDLFQMVCDTIFFYDAYKNIIYDKAKVAKKYGIPPERIGEYLALTGDKIDNIPGVPGIGPKRAVAILKQYDKFTDAVNNAKRINDYKEQATLSHKLTKLICDVPLDISADDLLVKEPDIDHLMPVLMELELHSYIKKMSIESSSSTPTKSVSDPSKIQTGEFITVFVEKNDTIYVCVDKDEVYALNKEIARPLLTDRSLIKVGHQLKTLVKAQVIEPPFFDTQIAAWLIDPNRRSYNLEDIILQHLKEIAQTDHGSLSRQTFSLYPVLKKKLGNQYSLYKKIEEPLIQVLANMEKRGIKIDARYFKQLSKEFSMTITQIENKIYTLAGKEFNVGSPKQLSKILFEDLGLTPIKRGKQHHSTNSDVLEQLGKKHELPIEVLKFREYSKIKSTYLDPLLNLAQNGRIHTTFNQHGTSTGRISSVNPNMQNIPIRTDIGRQIRKGFIAEKGFILISADYSQIELRILAHIANDKNLVDAFAHKKDIHTHTASLIFNIPEAKVTAKHRRMAKVVNYGLIYGMSEFGLASRLDIPHQEAMQFIDSYYNLYSGVAAWRETAITSAEEKGYTETLLGRRRPLPELKTSHYGTREFSKRAAINTPIQGTAADLIKNAMITVEKVLSGNGIAPGLILTIHDELVFEIEENRLDEATQIIRECMEQALPLKIPLVISIGHGRTWDQAHP